MTAVGLSTVKQFLNMSSGVDEDELLDTIDRAEAALSARVGPLTPITVVNEVHTATGPIVLRKRPVIAVTAVTSAGYAVTDTEFDTEAGILYGTFYDNYRGTRVSYTAGYPAPLPADLEHALLELTGHLWKSQRGASSTPLNPSEEAPSGTGYLLPYRVQSLIEPYLMPVRV